MKGSPQAIEHIQGRWLENSEVVDALHWLWSDASSFYTAQNLVLDNGLTSSLVPPALWRREMAGVVFVNGITRWSLSITPSKSGPMSPPACAGIILVRG